MTTQSNCTHLKRWSRPSSYMGAEWPDYFSAGVGQSRDSKPLERANFEAMRIALGDIKEPHDWPHEFPCWRAVRESHWAVGWVEWLAIHESAIAHLERANSIMESFEDYPVIDENLFSECETTEANEVWRDCYCVKERCDYIRKHKSQFEFRDFQDLIGCVRGNYFAGYASELIS